MINIVYIILFAFIFIRLTRKRDNFIARVYDDNQVLNKLQKIKDMYWDLKQLLIDLDNDSQLLNANSQQNNEFRPEIYTDQNSSNLSDLDIDTLIYRQIPLTLAKWKDISFVENKHQTYVQNKGCKLELSLIDANGKLYDTNTVRYVLIHEMSHIINLIYGHGPLFWKINKRMLYHAIVHGKYVYQDYRTSPFKYGSVSIQYNIIEDMCQSGKCTPKNK